MPWWTFMLHLKLAIWSLLNQEKQVKLSQCTKEVSYACTLRVVRWKLTFQLDCGCAVYLVTNLHQEPVTTPLTPLSPTPPPSNKQKSPGYMYICSFHRRKSSHSVGGGEGTPYNGLYGEVLPKRGTFFRLEVYKRVGISRAEVEIRAGKLTFRY